MLLNFFIAFVLVFSNLNAGGMESVFKGQKSVIEDTSHIEDTSNVESTSNKTDKTEDKVENKVDDASKERSAENVFKPVKIEKQKPALRDTGTDVSGDKEINNGSRAASVFGHKKASESDNAKPNASRAASVFVGHSVENNTENNNEEGKQVVEVNENSLEGDYSGKDFLWPVEKGQVSSYYGWRSSKKFHDGVDISAPTGTKIFAVKDGKVVYSGKKIRGYGNMIVIKHIGKIYTVYAHNSVNKVSTGDNVSKGDVIGLVGNTGHSHGPHVHFEVRQGKYSVDPLKYFNYMENKKGGHKHGFVHEFK